MARLRPVNLTDFTGGLATRRSQFTLAPNESPGMLNIEVDPRRGLYTRKGWERTGPDMVDIDVDEWDPRIAKLHLKADGTYDTYVANREDQLLDTGTVYVVDQAGTLHTTGQPTGSAGKNATNHIADFATWGDTMYAALGSGSQSYKRTGGTWSALTALTGSNFADDYTNPSGGVMPQAEFVEAHAGYLFVANIDENASDLVGHAPNRLRWSHPNRPEDWAELDFLDIERGGGKITGLASFRDHLLIFKTDSVWALYGYDLATWQLVEVTMQVGVPGPACFTKSESAVFFFSSSDRNGVYAYAGGAPVHLTEKLRTMIEQVSDFNDVTVGWLARRLWISLPLVFFVGGQQYDNTVLAFDPEVGDGVWTNHASVWQLGPFVERSDVYSLYPLAVMRTGAATLVQLEYRSSDAVDNVLADYGDDPIGDPYPCIYRTGWQYDGWPELRKSWLRPRYIFRKPPQPVSLRFDVFHSYDESQAVRSVTYHLDSEGELLWGDPVAEWGDDGLTWGASPEGGIIERTPRNLGLTPAVQIQISTDDSSLGRAWALDGIVLKYNTRRFTT